MFLLSQPSPFSLQSSILQLLTDRFRTIFNLIKSPKSTLICCNIAFTEAQLTDLQTITPPSPSIPVKVVKAKSHNSLMCAHAREGIFLKCKNVYTHFTPSSVPYFPKAYCTFTTALPCPITIALSFFHYRIFVYYSPPLFPTLPLFCSPPSSHSPSTFAPDDYLCFACTLRPLSRNSEMSTLQNKFSLKKNLHFSSIFSLFRLISSHIHIGAHPFSPLQIPTSTAKTYIPPKGPQM